MTDVFNNPSNDYILPALKPCESISDSLVFEFLPKEYVGVTLGPNIVTSMSLGDIQEPISDYSTEKKIIQSGEVVYIQGLTKGLIKRTQVFDIPYTSYGDNDKFFLALDLSINFYKNFKYMSIDIEASANFGQNIDIDDATNLVFGNNYIGINATYDSSFFQFQGLSDGWDFDIYNVNILIIDASLDINSPFPAVIDSSGNRVNQSYVLSADSSLETLAAKYINGAMQGVVLKTTFPNNSTITCSDEWIYLNHVPNTVTIWEQDTIDPSAFIAITKRVDVGLNGPDSSTVMGASGYLDFITTNNEWSKIGSLYARVNPPDINDGDTNLVNGFYLFNPHDFDVAVDYIIVK
jgi:hypothetical protein